jgi:molecular chaperone DnaK
MAKDNRTLGKFHLTGIPPAPRGIPQVEVTFDIDANGILNVNAKDKATGKEQNITITASSGLSEDDINRMVNEAEANEEEDQARREAIEARNQLDSLLYNTKKLVEENGDKIPDEEKLRAEEEFKNSEKILEDNKEPTEPDELRAALESLQSVAHKVAEAMYRGAGSDDDEDHGGNGADVGDEEEEDEQAGEDNVIDAEFEETT